MAPVAEDWKRISDIVNERAAELRLSMAAVRRRAGEPDGRAMDYKTVAKMADGEPLGTDRSRYRLARALDWPGSAISLLLDGADPSELPTVPFDGPDDPPDPTSPAAVAASDLADQRRVIAHLLRQVEALSENRTPPAPDRHTAELIAAYTGDAADIDFNEPGSTSRRRISTFEPDVDET